MVKIMRLMLVIWLMILNVTVSIFLVGFERIKGFKIFPGS